MGRPLYFDLTHLAFRAGIAALTGIDRVDLMYARALAASGALAGGVHHGLVRPWILPAERVSALVEANDRRWNRQADPAQEPRFRAARAWVLSEDVHRAAPKRAVLSRVPELAHKAAGHVRKASGALRNGPSLPGRAIYLNVSQHAAERRAYYRWLDRRPDVCAVFFLHDLMPLDHPEFWWPGHERLFEARVATMLQRADALIVASEAVRDRAMREFESRGLKRVPILAAPLPSPLGGGRRADDVDAQLAGVPYCVMIGTIEPRKNHRLILDVWRGFARSGAKPPKLVLVGGRGWGDKSHFSDLDGGSTLQEHVLETRGLSDGALRRLIVNARAVLVPSFAEGFGLPVIEGLTLGTPTIASDIPVFREVAGARAQLIGPTDGDAWSTAITRLETPADKARDAAAGADDDGRSDVYFRDIVSFVQALLRAS